MAIAYCVRKPAATDWRGTARCLATGGLAAEFPRMKPVKRSIAVLIRNGDRILSTRRPDHDDELPGVWGLPAGTFRQSETSHDLIARIGVDKLGVTLTPIRKISEGTQERDAYRLEMELWEAAMQGTPSHSAFQWAPFEILEPGVGQGSLCCELALQKGVRLL
jgi:8-oxo-dGTP diphosphatase